MVGAHASTRARVRNARPLAGGDAHPRPFGQRETGVVERAVGGLDAGFNLAMDGDLWERFSEHAPIAHLPRFLSCMRFYPEQKTRSLRPQALAENARIRNRRIRHRRAQPFYPFLHLFARLLRVALKGLSGGYTARVPRGYLEWLRQQTAEAG